MGEEEPSVTGPDFALGVGLADLADGVPLLGHVADQPVVVVRRGSDVWAVAATCTHYGGPLAEGIVVDDTIRCPWHHACFSLRTGAALRAPALDGLTRWRTEQRDGKVFVCGSLPADPKPTLAAPDLPSSIVIIGGGAAGTAAAVTLRQEGYAGSLTLLSADDAAPYDRPNLSKDYLAGEAPEDWLPLRPADFYVGHQIDLRLGARVTAIEPASHTVRLADGSDLTYGALLLATGAEPIRLDVPGADLPHVQTLRSLADSRALIAKASGARQCVVIGASLPIRLLPTTTTSSVLPFSGIELGIGRRLGSACDPEQ